MNDRQACSQQKNAENIRNGLEIHCEPWCYVSHVILKWQKSIKPKQQNIQLTRACFSEQTTANCRSGDTSPPLEVGEIRTFIFDTDCCPEFTDFDKTCCHIVNDYHTADVKLEAIIS
jgi:hypothetical protein